MNSKNLYLFLAIIHLGYSGGAHAASLLKPMQPPKTYSDTSFAQRIENEATGYKPFADRSAYQQLRIQSEEEYMVGRAQAQQQYDRQRLSHAEYCQKYELDETTCPQAPGQYEAVVSIGNRPSGDTTTPGPTPEPPTNTHKTSASGAPYVGHSLDGTPVYADTRVHFGPCTPPQHSNVFANQILTSGQYANSDPAFEKTMITTFRAEGGCGEHPNDSGGYTCYGISQNNNPEINVRNLTRADAERHAHKKYYTSIGIDKLPDYLRSDVFTFGWAAGPQTGLRALCRVLNLPSREHIDAEIVSAVENYSGDLHNDYLDALQQHFIAVSKKGGNHVFLKGWMNRVHLTRENGCHSHTTNPLNK